jgi:hypothetical protein
MKKVTPRLRGGLGNYLFQISAALHISIRDNKEFIINLSDISVIHSPIDTYISNIFRKLNFVDNFDDFCIHEAIQPISYSEIPSVDQNIKLEGYYQNDKYFKHIREEILELFSIDDDTKNYLFSKYSSVLTGETCSLHVRRGDYVIKSSFHPLQSVDYYKASISIVGEDLHYLIFSDDIDWCKEHLSFIKNKTFIDGNVDYQDLYLMSMCNHNIIANSSFSWWGAWMNQNNNKKVIYPSKWFGVTYVNTSGIGCENWIKI